MAFLPAENFAPLVKWIDRHEFSMFEWFETPGEPHSFHLACQDQVIAYADFVVFNESIRVELSQSFNNVIEGKKSIKPDNDTKIYGFSNYVFMNSMIKTNRVNEILDSSKLALKESWDCEDLLEEYILMAMKLELPLQEVLKCSPVILQAEASLGLFKYSAHESRILKVLQGTSDLEVAKIWLEASPTSWLDKVLQR